MAYDCHGAGQKVTQLTFNGQDWQSSPDLAEPMFEVYFVMRQLHELLMYLNEALKLPQAEPLYGELELALQRVDGLTRLEASSIVELDVSTLKGEVNELLMRLSELVRAPAGQGT